MPDLTTWPTLCNYEKTRTVRYLDLVGSKRFQLDRNLVVFSGLRMSALHFSHECNMFFCMSTLFFRENTLFFRENVFTRVCHSALTPPSKHSHPSPGMAAAAENPTFFGLNTQI